MAPLIMAAGMIAKVAIPALVGKLAGHKAEGVARAIVETASATTGLDAQREPATVADRLAKDPALLAQYRARLMDHAEILERLAQDDRRDARARDVALRVAHGLLANWRADLLAIGAVLLLWRIIEALLGGEAPADGVVRDALMMLFGAVIALVKDVYQFEFGSSRGSKDKARELAERSAQP